MKLFTLLFPHEVKSKTEALFSYEIERIKENGFQKC